MVLVVPLSVLVFAWCLEAHIELVQNPLDQTEGSLLIALTGLGAGVFCSMMFGTSMKQLEAVVPLRSVRWLRLWWLAMLVAILGVVGTIALLVRGVGWWYVALHWRNVAQGLSLGCLSACIVPRAAAWVAPAVALAACWLFGIKDLIGTPRLLAIPCYPPDSGVGWAVTCGFFVLVTVIYVLHDAAGEG